MACLGKVITDELCSVIRHSRSFAWISFLKYSQQNMTCHAFLLYYYSGHACTSIGLLTFILLELFVDHPNLFGRRHTTMTLNCDDEEVYLHRTFAWGYGWQKESHQSESNSPEPVESPYLEIAENDDRQMSPVPSSNLMSTTRIPNASSLVHKSNWILHYYSILWIVLLLPIPLSRVYLHDHTAMQVLVGSFVGVILGTVCRFCIVRGRLCRSGNVNSRTMMELVVNCRFGKWIGLNFGVDEGWIRMYSG
jgi:hypothetical protein